MQFVISHNIKPNINTTTDKIIVLLYGHLWALRKVSEGTNSGWLQHSQLQCWWKEKVFQKILSCHIP